MKQIDRDMITWIKAELYSSMDNNEPNFFWIAVTAMEFNRAVTAWVNSQEWDSRISDGICWYVNPHEYLDTTPLFALARAAYYGGELSQQQCFSFYKDIHRLEKRLLVLESIADSALGNQQRTA